MYRCSSCGKRYSSKGSLTRHAKQECGRLRMFQCLLCQLKFTRKFSLERHMRQQHEN